MCFFENNKIGKKNQYIVVRGAGVNLNQYQAEGIEPDEGQIKCLFIGRVMKDKGINEYLQAAKNIKTRKSNIEFQVLGFYDEGMYKEKIEEYERNNIIKYLGESNDTRKEMKEVDCIVLPSYHEGMSNVLLEGAAMGKPLITTNIHGCKEAVEDGVNGFLCEPQNSKSLEEALIKFMNLSGMERALMGKKSRTIIENKFDRNEVVETYIKCITNVLENKI